MYIFINSIIIFLSLAFQNNVIFIKNRFFKYFVIAINNYVVLKHYKMNPSKPTFELIDNDQVTLEARIIRDNKIKFRVILKPGEVVSVTQYETVFNMKEDLYLE